VLELPERSLTLPEVNRPVRCSDAARGRGDPTFATAPSVQQWLLIEHRGGWGCDILSGAGLDPGVARELGRWAEQTAGRVLLIRRPGPDRQTARLHRWCWADSRPGDERLRWGTFTDESDVLAVLRDPLASGESSDEPVYLVCAHGTHDVCCALRGRPLAAALAADHPQRTWECSHLGGHRFAANLVLLPHGLYYGQVPPERAREVVCRYDHGRLCLQWLRGRSSLPTVLQAAQHFARTATGETGVDSHPPVHCEQTGPDEWEVRLAMPGAQPLTVVVRDRMQLTEEPLSCAATGPGQFRVFDVVQA
jgi:hypothetical protein